MDGLSTLTKGRASGLEGAQQPLDVEFVLKSYVIVSILSTSGLDSLLMMTGIILVMALGRELLVRAWMLLSSGQ